MKKPPESIYSKKAAVGADPERLLGRSFVHPYLRQTSDLLDTDVESEQVQGLLAHCRQTCDRGAPLFHEGKVAVDPQLSLWLTPQLVHLCDLLSRGGGGAGLLEPRGSVWRREGVGRGKGKKVRKK